MRTLRDLIANPRTARLGTAWLAVAFVLAYLPSLAPLWPTTAKLSLMVSGHELLFVVAVLMLSAALVAGYEYLR